MRNFVKTALLSAILFSTLVGVDVKAGPVTGGLAAGIVFGAGAVWGYLKGPVTSVSSSLLNTIKLDPSTPDSMKAAINRKLVPEYAIEVTKIALAVGTIGSFLPTI